MFVYPDRMRSALRWAVVPKPICAVVFPVGPLEPEAMPVRRLEVITGEVGPLGDRRRRRRASWMRPRLRAQWCRRWRVGNACAAEFLALKQGQY